MKHGTDPNARDNWNFTPLHEAAIKGKVDVCISKGLGLEWDMYNYVYNLCTAVLLIHLFNGPSNHAHLMFEKSGEY